MSTILGRAAVWQLTNSVLSGIIVPHRPSFQNDWNVEAHAIQIVIFKLNPQYKEKAAAFPQGIQMTGLGGGRHEDWGACSGNLSEWESTWLAPGMGDICALTGGQRKVVNLASVSRLTRNKNHSKSRVFSEDTKVRLPLLLKLRVACDDRKLPLLGFCHQTVS